MSSKTDRVFVTCDKTKEGLIFVWRAKESPTLCEHGYWEGHCEDPEQLGIEASKVLIGRYLGFGEKIELRMQIVQDEEE